MKDKLLVEAVETLLNKNIKYEYDSAFIYYGMSSWLASSGFLHGAKLFKKYGDEELSHAHKVTDYLIDRNCNAIIPDVTKASIEFTDVKDILLKSYDHEKQVEDNWKIVANTAFKNLDHMTYDLALWFIREQREEVVKFRNLLDKLEALSGLTGSNYFIDEEFKKYI